MRPYALDPPNPQPRGRVASRLILLVALGLLALATPVRASADDTSRYLQTLQAAQADLRRNQPEAAGQVAARLSTIGPVTLSDATVVKPRLAGLIAMLEARPPDVDAARIHLNALMAELQAPEPAQRVKGGVDPRVSLQRVLDRQEFRPRELDPFSKYLQQALAPLGELAGRLLKPVLEWLAALWQGTVGDRLPSVDWSRVASVAALLLVSGLAVWIVRALRRAVGPGLVTQGAERRDAPTATALRAEALLLSQSGDFLGAMRAMYMSALLRWEERGMLRFDRSLTNRELLARARVDADQVVARALAPLTERFERSWYGGAPCSREEYGEFASLASAAWEIST